RPCVINVSLGTNGGPHDGSSLVEMAIDRLVTEAPNRAVVIAAGNSYDEDIHATGNVPLGEFVDLKWRIPKNDPTSNELEVWYSGQDEFTVEVIGPQKNLVATISPGKRWELAVNDQGILSVINRLNDPNNGDNLINVFFERGLPGGVWTLRLYGKKVNDGRFHAWIERDEGGQARFVRPSDKSYNIDNECTLGSIACGKETIVVGSYNAHKKHLPLSPNTSSGPTRDDKERQDHQRKPDLCAPGELVLAAHSRTLFLRRRQSGTSMAAPVVTGVIALMLAEARNREISLDAGTLRKILIETAQNDLPNRNSWDPRHGHGRVSAIAVSRVAEMAETGGMSVTSKR
ncbi:MAG: S8 family serine peptidase, partial [Blastocatellia bacterium]